MDAQAGNAAIGINFQAQMREAARMLDGKWIFGIARERRLRQQFDPARGRSFHAIFLVLIWRGGSEIAGFKRKVRREISLEMAGVHDDAANVSQ